MFFEIKEIIVFLNLWFSCAVYLFHYVIATEFDYRIQHNRFGVVLHAVDSLNVKHELRSNKAILYHADISKRYFSVCDLKIVFYFLHEFKQRSRSSDVTGRH